MCDIEIFNVAVVKEGENIWFKANAQDIAKALGMDIYHSKVLYKEQESISAIQKAFDSERMITQYAVDEYRIDLYFPKYHVAVECDEYGHVGMDEDKETERQEYIENKLYCRFVRYNPDRENFCIFKVINDIRVAMQV